MVENSWKKDIVLSLKNLNGYAHLSEIYSEVKRIRKNNINSTFDRTIRRELETNSSDSDVFNGKSDIFYMVEGKGKGVWGLRDYKNKFYWVSQNRTFKVERRDGYFWAPYKDKNQRELFHWSVLKNLKKGDIVFSHLKGTIPCISIVCDKAEENFKRPKEFSKSLPWMNKGRKVNSDYIDIEPLRLNRELVSKLNKFRTKKNWIFNKNNKHNEIYMLPFPLQAAKVLLDEIKKRQKITIDDFENFDENKSVSLDQLQKKKTKSSGQGFGLSYKERITIEKFAMEFVISKMKKENWEITDVSHLKDKGYDLFMEKNGEKIMCEVKGTTGSNSRVILTKNEVLASRKNFPNSALFIVSGIYLDRSRKIPSASLGKLKEIYNWKIEDRNLVPISYYYNL